MLLCFASVMSVNPRTKRFSFAWAVFYMRADIHGGHSLHALSPRNQDASAFDTPPRLTYICDVCFARQDGSQAAYPHWTKWTEAYVADADAKMKRAYASRLPLLRKVAREFDPHGMFMNDYFVKLLAP